MLEEIPWVSLVLLVLLPSSKGIDSNRLLIKIDHAIVLRYCIDILIFYIQGSLP